MESKDDNSVRPIDSRQEAAADTVDERVQKLYPELKLSREKAERLKTSSVQRLARRIRGEPDLYGYRQKANEIEEEISELLRERVGKYPLTELKYDPEPPLNHTGFSYGFEYPLGDEKFEVTYWAYNRWGILVQGHPKDYPPEIEIFKRTVEPDEEDSKEDPDAVSWTETEVLLHLPEGFKIPVGPLHFKSDSLPKDDKELSADKAQAIAIAKASGFRADNKTIAEAERLMPAESFRKYPDRYFWWQPVLPQGVSKIAIDFSDLEPYHMGLSQTDAPTFTDTLIANDTDPIPDFEKARRVK